VVFNVEVSRCLKRVFAQKKSWRCLCLVIVSTDVSIPTIRIRRLFYRSDDIQTHIFIDTPLYNRVF
jgi:hypothetical protein